jgi:hypothetical protein
MEKVDRYCCPGDGVVVQAFLFPALWKKRFLWRGAFVE